MTLPSVKRDGDWMQTFSGGRFYPLDPRAGEVEGSDIAHALSQLCRYGGHTMKFYCPTPEQRILTADLRWIPAGDLVVGDKLIGFDETPHELGMAGNRRRRFRPSTVLTAAPLRRRVIRLVMDDGHEVRSSVEHPWLVATKASRNQSWQTAGQIAVALSEGRLRYMHRFMDTWETDSSWATGWLAGILDGEGHASFDRRGVQFGVSQNRGLVLDDIETGMARLGFKYATHANKHSNCQNLQIRGGWRELARLLGTVRPVRLLDKFTTGLRGGYLDKQMSGVGAPSRIVAAYDEGEEWVSGLETSTRTYICEGYGAHNSVAEHCCLMAWTLEEVGLMEEALWALLHDATEAYVGDMVRPLKRFMPEYCAVEDRVMGVVAEKFGLVGGMPAVVKELDNRILLNERAAMTRKTKEVWALDDLEPLDVVVEGWSPEKAEWEYLAALNRLTSDRAK